MHFWGNKEAFPYCAIKSVIFKKCIYILGGVGVGVGVGVGGVASGGSIEQSDSSW